MALRGARRRWTRDLLPSHARERLGAGIRESALESGCGEVGAVLGVVLVPSLLRLAVLHVVQKVLLPLRRAKTAIWIPGIIEEELIGGGC